VLADVGVDGETIFALNVIGEYRGYFSFVWARAFRAKDHFYVVHVSVSDCLMCLQSRRGIAAAPLASVGAERAVCVAVSAAFRDHVSLKSKEVVFARFKESFYIVRRAGKAILK
jgi:hypothetical protein